jgi:hypothetical protein
MKNTLVLLLAASALLFSCKKNTDAHIPPDMAFKTGGTYVSASLTKPQGDSINVGIIITKTEDDLRTFNISYAYDGATSTTTHYNYVMAASEYTGYNHDFWLHMRNQAGTERWVFTVTDRDGNLTQKELTVTVP